MLYKKTNTEWELQASKVGISCPEHSVWVRAAGCSLNEHTRSFSRTGVCLVARAMNGVRYFVCLPATAPITAVDTWDAGAFYLETWQATHNSS